MRDYLINIPGTIHTIKYKKGNSDAIGKPGIRKYRKPEALVPK
jgi:hypothetical protein